MTLVGWDFVWASLINTRSPPLRGENRRMSARPARGEHDGANCQLGSLLRRRTSGDPRRRGSLYSLPTGAGFAGLSSNLDVSSVGLALYSLPTELGFAVLFAHGARVRSTLCPWSSGSLYSLLTELGFALLFAHGARVRSTFLFLLHGARVRSTLCSRSSIRCAPVSYTHLTLPTICSV